MNEELRFLIRFASETGALKKARDEVLRFAQSERAAAVGSRDVQQGAERAAASVKRFGTASAAGAAQVRTEFARAGAAVRSLASVLAAAGLGLSFAGAVQVVTEYGSAISRVQAITGELARTADGELNPTFAAVEETVRRLGATTVFTAGQSAEAFALLSQAGFSAAEGIRAVAGVLDLAVVGAIDLSSSADIVANTVRSFGLAASEASRVADVFAETVTKSNTNVLELGEALKFVGPVAANLGVSLEESAAAVGVLSDAGLKGTLAGTGLRRVLVGLTAQTPKATKVLKAAGIEVEALEKGLTEQGLIAALEQFEGRTLGAAEAVDVFGLRGGPAFLVLQDAAERAGTLSKALEEAQGRAEEFAKVQRDTLAGDLKLLTSVIEDAVLGSGEFNDVLRSVVQTTTGVVQALTGTLDPLDENAARYRELARSVEAAFEATKLLLGAYAAFRAFSIVQAVGAAASAMLGLGAATGTAAGAAAGLRAALISTGIGGLVVLAGGAAVALADMAAEVSRTDEVVGSASGAVGRANEVFERTKDLTGELALQQLPALRGAVEDLEKQFKSLGRQADRAKNEALALREVGTFADVVGSDQLTALEKAKAAVLGLGGALLGLSFDEVAAAAAAQQLDRDLGVVTGTLDEVAEAKRRLDGELEEAAALEAAEKSLRAVDARVKALGESLADSGKVASEFRDTAEKAFEDLAVEIGDLSLGTGREADLQRKVNAALRAADLEVSVPVELELARGQALEDLARLERELAEARRVAGESGLESGSATVAQAEVQLELARRTVRELDETTAARARQREQIVGEVVLVRDLAEANEKAAAKEKERLELSKRRAALNIAAGAEADRLLREVELAGLSTRERERQLFVEEQLVKAREAGLVGLSAEQERLVAVRDAAEAAARTDVRGAIASTLGDVVDEGTNFSKLFSDAVGGSIEGVTGQLKEFAKTGKLEVADLARSILNEFIDLGVELAVAGVTDQIRKAFLPQQQGASASSGGGGGGASAALGVVGAIGGAFSGGGGGGFGSFIGSLFKADGGYSDDAGPMGLIPASRFRHARRFEFGGVASGRDTIPAMLSPNEAVVPLNRNRAIPVEGNAGGGTTINATFNIQTPDVAGFQKSRGQVEAGMFAAMRRAAERNGERTT